MMNPCRHRDIAKLVAVTLLFAILRDSWASFDGSAARMVSSNLVWEAFLLLGLSLGLGFPRAILRGLVVPAGLACLAAFFGHGDGIASVAAGFVGFAIAVAINRWVDALSFPARVRGVSLAEGSRERRGR